MATESKHEYDKIAKEYFESKGYDATISGGGGVPDLKASKGNKKSVIEVKGPAEPSAGPKFDYPNKIAGMERREIADLFDSTVDRKTLRGYIGLSRLYCYGIASQLYHYYKEEKIKSEGEVEAFFCVPAEGKYSVAITSAIDILKGLGFIQETSRDEYPKDGKKIIIIKIQFNEKITKKDAKENVKKEKNNINEKIKEAKARNLKEFVLKYPGTKIIPGLPAIISNPATLNAAGIAIIVIICLILLWFIIKFFMSGYLNTPTIPTKDIAMKNPSIVAVAPAKPLIILFDFDKSTINSVGKESLNRFVEEAKMDTGKKIRVDGHTCNIGTEEYNKILSLRRADSVKAFLLQKGFLEENIIEKGLGSEQPFKGDETKEGRKQNRRVEICVE